MTELIFVRHGQTRSNVEQLLHGRTDEPLNPLGLWQAQRVADRVSAIGPFNHIYSSPLSRARVTASAIATQVGAEIRLHEDLAEFNFGEFEGATVSTIQESHPEIYKGMYDVSDAEFRYPGGESRREFHTRVLRAINDILTTHPGERLVVVAHEGVIVSAVMQMTGGDPNDWTRHRLGNCSITRVESNGSAIGTIACWNDTQHLTAVGNTP